MLRLSTNKTFWHKAKNGHTFLDISDCVSPTSSLTSTARGVTHHAEANMPIVRATSRVCKFHTCPIILPPTLPPSALPLCAFSPLTHAPPPLAHPHLTLNSLRSRKRRCLAKNMQQKPEEPAESDRTWQYWRPFSVLLSSLQTGKLRFTTFTFMIRCMKAGI